MEFINKQSLRDRVLTLIRNQEESERLSKSTAIAAKLYEIPAFQKAEQVLFYASFDGEVDTFPMIKQAEMLGKKIGLPKIDKATHRMTPYLLDCSIDDCLSGPYGIKEPAASAVKMKITDKNTIIVVPGVAFDKQHNRIGRGAGFYDRFLENIPQEVSTVGLAYDFQVFDELPFIEDHDVPLSTVVTN